MSLKIINITIPEGSQLQNIDTFSPEENYLMLKIGSNCLIEGRKVVAGLTQKEIYQKIKNESKDEIQRLEMNIILEKEMTKKMEERITSIYESQIEKLQKQITLLSNQVKTFENGNNDLIKKEVSTVRERYDLLLEQKDKQMDKMNDNYEKLLVQQSSKSTSHKGSEGEKTFSEYADTFMDFKGFEIVDKHTQGGEGDFHLHFEEFDVLADAKNYQ